MCVCLRSLIVLCPYLFIVDQQVQCVSSTEMVHKTLCAWQAVRHAFFLEKGYFHNLLWLGGCHRLFPAAVVVCVQRELISDSARTIQIVGGGVLVVMVVVVLALSPWIEVSH